MSSKTEMAMLAAIREHFTDEGVTLLRHDAVQVSVLGRIDFGNGPRNDMPAHYRMEPTSDLHARALYGSMIEHNGCGEGPLVRSNF